MKVTLLDFTGNGRPDYESFAAYLLVFTKRTRLEMSPEAFADTLILPWEDIEAELRYMANTIPSSWEFCHYTFLIQDVTRAFTHQFVRTRTGSYAQQTMRVLNVEGWTYETPPSIEYDVGHKQVYDYCMEQISDAYNLMTNEGCPIEDARGVLPTNIHTNITAGFNLRTICEMVRKRSSPRVQGEYRDVLQAMQDVVMAVHPWTKIFFESDFNQAASDLDVEVASLNELGFISDQMRTKLHKLVDKMRQS